MIRSATPGELGLALFHLEKAGLILGGAANTFASLAVLDGDEYVGIIQLYTGHAPKGVIGCSVYMWQNRQKGLMRAAMLEVMALLDKQDWARIEAYPAADNVAACKLAESLNWSREGTLKGWYLRDGKYVDAAVYGKANPKCLG